MSIYLYGASDCDLARLFASNRIDFELVESPAAALASSSDGDAIILTAPGYPEKPLHLPDELREAALAGRRRIYAEFFGAPGAATLFVPLERVVVATDRFGAELPPLSIVMAHECHYLECSAVAPWLVSAKVAGVDIAVYGLPETVHPLLFRLGRNSFAAATALSRFITGRYAPAAAWGEIWRRILSDLLDRELPELVWTPDVEPSFAKDAPITAADQLEAACRGAAWFDKSRILLSRERYDQCKKGANGYPDEISRGAFSRGIPAGDGSCGMIEGVYSAVNADGSQNYIHTYRADCMGEATMALALAARTFGVSSWRGEAENLSRYLFETSYFLQGPRADAESASCGLAAWMGNDVKNGVYYGDDNARMILGGLAAASAIPGYGYLDVLARCITANLRTTGRLGFRGDRLEDEDMQKLGWKYYFDREYTNFAPHFESWLWACYFWAYAHGGSGVFLERGDRGVTETMANYPDNWVWTNGIQQERARMILPLAWRLRVADTAENREQLEFMVEEVLRSQDAGGAIREEVGSAGKGKYGPCPSNAAYGETEAPLIQTNGDSLCDLLYTTNFAFIGLHEAVAVTGNATWKQAEDRLAAFLTRIQVKSGVHDDLDGAWFRAFDFSRHDYWGSNADAGWGVWNVESGWTQSWIVATLCLRASGTNLWDATAGVDMRSQLAEAEELLLKI
ncbi:MAG: hypothetical protein AB7F40_01035 [Victivallaceae bacterium]|nr:hypothetical protein [Victivallaceae bacterium]